MPAPKKKRQKESKAPAGQAGGSPEERKPPEAPPQCVPEPGAKRKNYFASIVPGPNHPLPEWIVEPVLAIQKQLKIPIWLFVQNGTKNPYCSLNQRIFRELLNQRHCIRQNQDIALIIESPGGDAHEAFKVARIFQRRAKSISVVIPCYAKSAATMLALVGHELILGQDAELGPLDVQVLDPEREEVGSALNAVQSLERLSAFSLTLIDATMMMLLKRTGKKIDTTLPLVLQYASSFLQPLLSSLDTVDYTRNSRRLKIAEQYAIKLMASHYPEDSAVDIARKLVTTYPTHGFVIDKEEAWRIGIRVSDRKIDLEPLVEMMCGLEEKELCLIGLFYEGKNENDKS